MPQDRNSGSAGARFGLETAPKIAAALGAIILRPGSNEAVLNGTAVAIHCAGKSTTSVGVLYEHLERVKYVLAAFQHKDGSFDVYQLPVATFEEHMRDSMSNGPSGGRVGLVTKKVFTDLGKRIKIVRNI